MYIYIQNEARTTSAPLAQPVELGATNIKVMSQAVDMRRTYTHNLNSKSVCYMDTIKWQALMQCTQAGWMSREKD